MLWLATCYGSLAATFSSRGTHAFLATALQELAHELKGLR